MARTVPIEVLHEESNFVVLQMPGRRYPRVVIQGDTLGGIVGNLREAIRLFETDRDETREILKGTYEALKSKLDHYTEICLENGIK